VPISVNLTSNPFRDYCLTININSGNIGIISDQNEETAVPCPYPRFIVGTRHCLGLISATNNFDATENDMICPATAILAIALCIRSTSLVPSEFLTFGDCCVMGIEFVFRGDLESSAK
jgi:hypothetical protein